MDKYFQPNKSIPVVKVPGLFEGDEYTTLMTQCKEGSQRDGLMLDSSEELYKWFTEQVRNSYSRTGKCGIRYLPVSNRCRS